MFTTVSAYIVLSLITITAIILLFIIIHLGSLIKVHYNDPMIPPKMKRKKVSLLSLTMLGVLCFECSIILMGALLLQLILIDNKAMRMSKFHQLDYLIFVLDAVGHVSILYAFTDRFEYCFQSSLSNYNRRFILVLRAILLLMLVFSAGIVAVMLHNASTPAFIFALDMTAELVLQIVALCLFYLFIVHSYRLITMSFPKNTQFRDFVRHLDEKYEQHKVAHFPSASSNSPHPSLAITIDGMPTMAVRAVKTPTMSSSHEDELKVPIARWAAPGHSDPVDLVHVMNRKILLAAMVVLCSILNVLVIAFVELQHYNELKDAQAIWVFMLIVFDMLVTALMMYLQFTFNQKAYWNLCSKVDLWMVGFVLKLLKCCWVREHQRQRSGQHEEEHQKKPGQISIEEAMQREVDSYKGVEIQIGGGKTFKE